MLTSALDGDEWSASRHGCFIPRERAAGTHRNEGWVGPRTGLDAVAKRKIHIRATNRNPLDQSVAQSV
jgi:hypothetical protein